MNTIRDTVALFMRRIGAEVRMNPPNKLDSAIATLRLNLMLEELNETASALRIGDIIAIADGFADFKYVVAGTAAAIGIDFADTFVEPNTFAERTNKPRPDAALRLLACCLPLLSHLSFELESVEGSNWARVRNLLESLDMAAAHIASAWLGLPMRELFEEVHRANMTKQASNQSIGAAKYPQGGKGAAYQEPNIADILRTHGFVPAQLALMY